jgi:hypothetical protein
MPKTKKLKGVKQNDSGKSRRFHDILEGDCIFPFIYQGKVFNECIPDTRGGKYNGSRCATKVDDIGNLEKWGYCPKQKTPSPQTKKASPPKKKRSKKKVSSTKQSRVSEISVESLRLPKWYNNSCFIDSVLVCLFLRPNPYLNYRFFDKPLVPYVLSPGKFTEEEIRERTMSLNTSCNVEARSKIRQELLNISNYIHDNIDNNKLVDRKSKTGTKMARRVRNFRESMTGCVLPTYEDYTGKAMAEANEFLKYLFSIFPDEDAPNLLEKTYFTNDIETEIETIEDIVNLEGELCLSETPQKTDIYLFLSPSDIFNAEDSTFLSDFLESKEESIRPPNSDYVCEGKNYERAIKFREVTEERYLIFDLSRSLGGDYLDNSIIPDEEIELKNGKKFKFVSAVHRRPGMGGTHFTSYVLIGDLWYFYDDNPGGKEPVLDEVGSYDDLLGYEEQEIMECVMYFYEPI